MCTPLYSRGGREVDLDSSISRIRTSNLIVNDSETVRTATLMQNITIQPQVRIKNSINKDKLKCLYFNARSIVNKIQELELLVKNENIDIVGITETWLNVNILDSEMNIEGYTLLRKDRGDNRRGGGVALYIRNDISFICCEDLFEVDFPETLFCSITCGKEKTLIGVCYRPPSSLVGNDKALYSLLGRVSKDRVIIMGDFNFPELDWCKIETLSDTHPFIKCINNNFLDQLVDKPTRGDNILDLIMTTDVSIINNLVVGEPFETSDHQLIRWELVGKTCLVNNSTTSFNYFKANYDEIRKFVKKQNWGSIFESQSVETSWGLFKRELISLRNKFVPKFKKSKNRCKWVTREVVRLRKAKVKAWNNYIKSGRDKRLFEVYKSKLRLSVRENNRAKQCFEERLAGNIKNDSKSFFAYVRSKQRTKVTVGPLKNQSGDVISDNKTAADVMNDYFASVFTVEDVNNIPEPVKNFNSTLEMDKLNHIEIYEQDVRNKLESLKINKSPGPDGIHAKLLYELRDELVILLTKFFNLSIKTGIVPQDWKDANVSPLFKKGSKAKPENYRPVSLTSIVGKMLESIIKDHITEHLNRFKLIKSSQHGFSKGRSCLTNLLEFFEEVTKELDMGNPVDIVYLDFAKAFDKVPYMRLFKKLEAHGIEGVVLNWVKNWLGGRRQQVCINKECSNWRDVTSGVPQGSVLGPVLFIIYINDLENDLVSRVGKFADDTKMSKSVRCVQDAEILRDDLKKLDEWAQNWQMQFNKDKCVVMHVGRSNSKFDYELGGKLLNASAKEKDLGIIVDNSMKFSEQCNAAIKNANSMLGLIRRNIKNKSKNIMVRLYKGLVRPKLEYCVQAWRPFLKKDIKNLEKIQRRATRMIEGCRGLKYVDRLEAAGLISLEDRRTRGDLIEVFKMVKGLSKIDYKSFFKLDDTSRTRGHMYKLVKVRSRLDIRKNCFSQRVVSEWNKLPAVVVEAESVNSFKNRYDRYISEMRKL